MKFRVSIDLEGELADAFLKELSKRIQEGGSSSKADMGRTLIALGLQRQGYSVSVPDTRWGGHREATENEPGELEAVA